MEEIKSVHGKADGTPIKDIKVCFVPYDGATPTIREFNGSVYCPGQTILVSRVPVL
jgi:hypothetical protein